MFTVNHKNTRTKLNYNEVRMTPECRSGVFTLNFEHISHLVPVLL